MSYHINPKLSLTLLSTVSLLLLVVGSTLPFQVQAQNSENQPTSRSMVCINDQQCQTYVCEGNEPCGTSVRCDSNNECTAENSPSSTLQPDLDDEIDDDMDEIEDYMDD
jgi:hypothetical protein